MDIPTENRRHRVILLAEVLYLAIKLVSHEIMYIYMQHWHSSKRNMGIRHHNCLQFLPS